MQVVSKHSSKHKLSSLTCPHCCYVTSRTRQKFNLSIHQAKGFHPSRSWTDASVLKCWTEVKLRRSCDANNPIAVVAGEGRRSCDGEDVKLRRRQPIDVDPNLWICCQKQSATSTGLDAQGNDVTRLDYEACSLHRARAADASPPPTCTPHGAVWNNMLKLNVVIRREDWHCTCCLFRERWSSPSHSRQAGGRENSEPDTLFSARLRGNDEQRCGEICLPHSHTSRLHAHAVGNDGMNMLQLQLVMG